jgi:ABC-type enterochelin transport system permease subunit
LELNNLSLKPSNNLRRSCVGIVANSVVIAVCDLSRVIGEYIRIIAYPIIISISCFFGVIWKGIFVIITASKLLSQAGFPRG